MKNSTREKHRHKRTAKSILVDKAVKLAERAVRENGQTGPLLIRRETVTKAKSSNRKGQSQTLTDTALSLELRRVLGSETNATSPKSSPPKAHHNPKPSPPISKSTSVDEGIKKPKTDAKLNHHATGSSTKKSNKQKKAKPKKHVGSSNSKARLRNSTSKSIVDEMSKARAARKARLAAGRLELNKRLAMKAAGVKDQSSATSETADMSFEQLRRLWIAAIKYLEKFGSDSSADDIRKRKLLIDEIEAEWTSRLELLRDGTDKFEWPSTDAPKGQGILSPQGWHDTGMLGYLEYSVAKSEDTTAAQRQALLTRIFIGQLPPLNSHHYMQQWFRPNSAARLQKMAESLAAFARNAKRKKNAPVAAIAKWESDLSFLHDEFYKGRFDFGWPST